MSIKRLRHRFLLAIVIFSLSSAALSSPDHECFKKASLHYSVDEYLLKAIAKVESRYTMSATNVNKDGSTDHGIMQINSPWKNTLMDMGIAWENVVEDPCTNIHVGAWILASNFASHGASWYSVGAYNAGFGTSENTRRNRLIYVNKVKLAYEELMYAQCDNTDRNPTYLCLNRPDR